MTIPTPLSEPTTQLSADPTDRDGIVRRSAAIAVAMAIVLAAVGVPLTLWLAADRSDAAFADREVIDGNRLGAGTVDLDVGEAASQLGARNLAPGDVVTGEVVLRNAGTLPLIVSVDASIEGEALGAWLRFDVWSTSGRCAAAPPATRSLALSGVPAPVVGGEQAPRLAPDAEVRVCVQAALPLSTPNDVQDRELTLDLRFLAEHDVEASR